MEINEIYTQAKLSQVEVDNMPFYIDGSLLFYGSSAYGKLYDYFCDSGEMPYGIAKARDGDPDLWILEKLENQS